MAYIKLTTRSYNTSINGDKILITLIVKHSIGLHVYMYSTSCITSVSSIQIAGAETKINMHTGFISTWRFFNYTLGNHRQHWLPVYCTILYVIQQTASSIRQREVFYLKFGDVSRDVFSVWSVSCVADGDLIHLLSHSGRDDDVHSAAVQMNSSF